MDDPPRVAVFQRQRNLRGVLSRVRLPEPSQLPQQRVQIASDGVLGDDVQMPRGRERVEELHDERVVRVNQRVSLRHRLLRHVFVNQIFFANHLDGVHVLRRVLPAQEHLAVRAGGYELQDVEVFDPDDAVRALPGDVRRVPLLARVERRPGRGRERAMSDADTRAVRRAHRERRIVRDDVRRPIAATRRRRNHRVARARPVASPVRARLRFPGGGEVLREHSAEVLRNRLRDVMPLRPRRGDDVLKLALQPRERVLLLGRLRRGRRELARDVDRESVQPGEDGDLLRGHHR
eukprot:31026-Pelagococcus_subviridis.AAC.1